MALVYASQGFVLEGFSELKLKEHWWSRSEYKRTQITLITGVSTICDETDVEAIIEQKIQEDMKKSGWGRNFEGWTSYRKYFKPGELFESPEGKDALLRIEYIRDWKMEKIIKELDGNQFSVLCKELGISAGEAFLRA